MIKQIVNENTPGRQYQGAYVYAVLFSDGWVKVGRGADPIGRIRVHQSVSKMRGASMEKKVISGKLVSSRKAEERLIAHCKENGNPIWGNEWFSRVDFDQLECLILDEFSGDSDEQFEAAAIASAKKHEEFTNKLNKLFPGRDEKWIFCFQLAQLMRTMFLNNGNNGPLFGKSIKGASPFEIWFSLVAYFGNENELADLIAEASESISDSCVGDFLYRLEIDTNNLLVKFGYLKPEAA